MSTEFESASPERRKHRRFAMEMEVHYTLPSGESGMGESVNISTGGLFFRCEEGLPVGQLIRAELMWPFALESGQPLRLCLHGMILRSDSGGTAMSVSKHYFRMGE